MYDTFLCHDRRSHSGGEVSAVAGDGIHKCG